jgi:uncharacterized protein YbjT (DUF2867 family)
MAGPSGATGLVLLTGASGYVGGRLLKSLEGRGYRVRCLARRPGELAARVGEATEVVAGNALDPESPAPALAGVESAYYLIHSMGAGKNFELRDRAAAQHFGRAAQRAGVRRIIYLGGLGRGKDLSPHLRSRHEVGEILRESGVPVVELRSSIVIGSCIIAFGFSIAHLRVATAISASCSLVVPYSCMWRQQASA